MRIVMLACLGIVTACLGDAPVEQSSGAIVADVETEIVERRETDPENGICRAHQVYTVERWEDPPKYTCGDLPYGPFDEAAMRAALMQCCRDLGYETSGDVTFHPVGEDEWHCYMVGELVVVEGTTQCHG